MTDQVIVALLNAPAYALMAFLFWKFLRQQSDESKRRSLDQERQDAHEDKMIDALLTDRRRIDEIEADRRKVEDARRVQNDAWIQAIDNSTQMVKALEARSTYLLQSDKELSELQVAIRSEVKILFDRFTRVFPDDTSISARFDELKAAMITEIERTCSEKKLVTSEVQKIEATISLQPAPADKNETDLKAAS